MDQQVPPRLAMPLAEASGTIFDKPLERLTVAIERLAATIEKAIALFPAMSSE